MAQNLVASPPPAGNISTSTNNNNAAATTTAVTSPSSTKQQSPNQQRIAVLRVKRQDLEKRLQEKNSLLQELCRKEAHLIGVYPTVTVAGQEGHLNHHPSSSADDIGGLLLASSSGGKTQHSTHSLPRKIGTGFTLSEKYLNKRTPSANSPLNAPNSSAAQREDEELNNLLLQRDIQQQICKASLKLLNDVALTKSVRRKHKQSYEVAQQKLMDIGKGLTTIQKKQQRSKQNQEAVAIANSQTLPLAVKTNFKVPQNYSGESPVLERNSQHLQKRNRHDSYNNPHHSPASISGGPIGYPSTSTTVDNKGLYRSTSNSSSLNNAHVLGKSSLSLDNHLLLQQQQQQQQLLYPHHHSAVGQPQSSSTGQGHGKPTSYESKSLHNFVMSSPNHSSSAYQSSPYHHPALNSPTFYNAMPQQQQAAHQRLHHHQSFAMTTSRAGATSNHYPGNAAGLRQSHQQQQQFMSPPPQQVVIPQSGLGGYWTLNENNERVWCPSGSAYSPEPSGPQQQPQRYGGTLDRKAAIYVPNTSSTASHGKLKMPSPEASPNGGVGAVHSSHGYSGGSHNQPHQQGYGGGGVTDGNFNNNTGKSFSIPNKSTSLGNIEFLHATSTASMMHQGGREDTTSLGSFSSDTNNNPSVYHHLVSAMAATTVSHYPLDGQDLDDDADDDNNFDNNNNNGQATEPPPPRPMRPKSSASQHAPEKSWYETSLDKVANGPGSKMTPAGKSMHKPPALLPREMNQQQPQLHIDIPTSPLHQQQQQYLNPQHPQLERSMSHRIVGTSFSTAASSPPPPPPIMRQAQPHHHQQQQQQEEMGGTPMSPHKKLVSTSSSGNGNGNSNHGHANPVRRSQSNVLIMGGGQQQQQQQSSSSSSTALLSPRLVNGQTTNAMASPSPAIQKVAADDGSAIQVESPKNMTVVQQGKFQPYKEESKPFEMSDFYKYSTKFRQQQGSGKGEATATMDRSSSRNVDENMYRGNVLYQQQQQQQQLGFPELADVANNNNNGSSSIRGSSNNHNNTNAHILQKHQMQ